MVKASVFLGEYAENVDMKVTLEYDVSTKNITIKTGLKKVSVELDRCYSVHLTKQVVSPPASGAEVAAASLRVPACSSYDGPGAADVDAAGLRPAVWVPQDPSYLQAIMNITTVVDTELENFREWRQKRKMMLVEQFGSPPERRWGTRRGRHLSRSSRRSRRRRCFR